MYGGEFEGDVVTELSQIAQSVAEALGLRRDPDMHPGWLATSDDLYSDSGYFLSEDGSNVFDLYWQARCRDWLLERGDIQFVHDIQTNLLAHGWRNKKNPWGSAHWNVVIRCPAAEFCARAIHQLASISLPTKSASG